MAIGTSSDLIVRDEYWDGKTLTVIPKPATVADTGGGGGEGWLLASGAWGDAGVWDDASMWKDAA